MSKAAMFTRGQAFALKQMLSLLERCSDESIVALTRAAEVIARDPRHKGQIAWIRGLFEQGHPCIELTRRILRDTDPRVRENVLMNLFVRATWEGAEKRKAFEKAHGFQPPFLIVISPTMRCNLHCFGCYAGAYSRDEELATEEIDRVVAEAKDMGIYFITISGGEPFVRRDLLDIFRKHNDVAFHIYTNGTLIDEEMAKSFAELGNVAPAISVEGFEKETDLRRGKGAYRKIVSAMQALNSHGCMYGFSATVTRRNADLLISESFLEHYLELGAYFGWFFVYIPIGWRPSVELMPTPEQRNRLCERTLEIRRTRPIFVGDFWNDGPLTGGCMAGGRLYAHVNHRGDVEPCVFSHFAVDNIRDKSLHEALNSPFFRSIRSRQPFNENHLTPCMIIDNPQILRDVVSLSNAYSTDTGGEALLNGCAAHLDAYAAEYHSIARGPWERDYEWARGS